MISVVSTDEPVSKAISFTPETLPLLVKDRDGSLLIIFWCSAEKRPRATNITGSYRTTYSGFTSLLEMNWELLKGSVTLSNEV